MTEDMNSFYSVVLVTFFTLVTLYILFRFEKYIQQDPTTT